MPSAETLAELVRGFAPGCREVMRVHRLTGGASQETWSFDARTDDGVLPLILRRSAGGKSRDSTRALSLADEARLIGLAEQAGVPVPRVLAVLPEGHALGPAYLMSRVEGETIPRRFLRDPALTGARAGLARQCGGILARLHAITPDRLPRLRVASARAELGHYLAIHRAHGEARPVFTLAARWLDEHAPPEDLASGLVHGDFRSGNLMIDAQGVAAVLDWELAHVGDPMEDLGWLCVNSWRFGRDDKPVGGFGNREDLFAGYEAAGGPRVDPRRVRYWQVLGSLKWGVMCGSMLEVFRLGEDRSIERASIGRRASETEIDLLRLMAGRD